MKNGKERRDAVLQIRVTKDEIAKIKANADKFGLSMSEYIRLVTVRGKAGRPKNSGRYTPRVAPKMRFRLIAQKLASAESPDK